MNNRGNGLVTALIFVAVTILLIVVIWWGVTHLDVLISAIGIGALIAWFWACKYILGKTITQ